jgi:hypothetical protein
MCINTSGDDYVWGSEKVCLWTLKSGNGISTSKSADFEARGHPAAAADFSVGPLAEREKPSGKVSRQVTVLQDAVCVLGNSQSMELLSRSEPGPSARRDDSRTEYLPPRGKLNQKTTEAREDSSAK